MDEFLRVLVTKNIAEGESGENHPDHGPSSVKEVCNCIVHSTGMAAGAQVRARIVGFDLVPDVDSDPYYRRYSQVGRRWLKGTQTP